MPDFGTSNRVALRQVAETTWGVTPATPTLNAIRFTSEGLNYNAEFITSEEIRADRMTPDTIQVSSSAGGEINGEWSYGTYDSFIEAALYGTWVTTGTTVTAATDIAIVKTSGTPNTWALTSTVTDFSAQNWAVGQFIRVSGFSPAGTFFAEILGITANSLSIAPLSNVASDAAGDSVTIRPMNYVRNGTTKRSFTIQKAFTDLATPELWNFTGSRISTWSLELTTGSILTTTFGVLAKDANMTETQFAGATVGAANTNTVLNAVDNIASIVFDGDPGGATYYFNSLSIELDNALRGQEAVGTLGFIGVEAGRLSLTGSIELYFENSALFDKFRAATAISLSFLARDAAGNSYVVTIPRAKFTSMEIVAGGNDQDIFAAAEFEGIINSAGTYQYQISRLPA
ncbi:tail tube protein [Pseudanabaena phage Pan1]|nr:tail tube protein [Pseudanabaena phage Pan1]